MHGLNMHISQIILKAIRILGFLCLDRVDVLKLCKKDFIDIK